MRVSTVKAIPGTIYTAAFLGVLLAYVDFAYFFSLPIVPVNLFLLALVLALSGTVFRAAVSDRVRGELLSLYVAHRSVIIPLAGIVIFSFVAAFLPRAYWDEGPRYLKYPVYSALVILLSMLLPFAAHHRRHLRAYLAIALVLLTASVLVDAVHPGTFSIIKTRAAGFGGNPNTSAFVLVALCCSILDFERVRPPDLLIVLATALGVLATLSRGGMIMFALVLACYSVAVVRAGHIRPARIVGVVTILVALGGLVVVSAKLFIERANIFSLAQQQRLGMLRGQSEIIPSTDSRFDALFDSWRLIQEAPLLGHGVGFTYTLPQGPHNIYLQQWVNTGLAGLVCFVWLLAAAGLLFWRRRYRRGLVFMGVVAMQGLFSHNLLDERAFLALFGILLTDSYYAAREAVVSQRTPVVAAHARLVHPSFTRRTTA